MKTEAARDRFRPWAGLALGTLGFFLSHQLGSDATFQDCVASSPWLVIVGTLAGLALIAVGALLSWRVYVSRAEAPARRLVAVVSLLSCALFTMAVVLPLIAALLIPQCWA